MKHAMFTCMSLAFVLVPIGERVPAQGSPESIDSIRTISEWKEQRSLLYTPVRKAQAEGARISPFWEAMRPIGALEASELHKSSIDRSRLDEEVLAQAYVDTIGWALPLFARDLRWHFIRGYLNEAQRRGASEKVMVELMYRAAAALPPKSFKVDGRRRKLTKTDSAEIARFQGEVIQFLADSSLAKDVKSAAKTFAKEMGKRKASHGRSWNTLLREINKKRATSPVDSNVELGDEPGLVHDFWVGERDKVKKILKKSPAMTEVRFLKHGEVHWWLDAPQNKPRPPEIHAQPIVTRMSGVLSVPETGEYVLKFNFDDGARLWINDKLVFDVWDKDSPLSWVIVPLSLSKASRFRLVHFEDNTTSTTGIVLRVAKPSARGWTRVQRVSFSHSTK